MPKKQGFQAFTTTFNTRVPRLINSIQVEEPFDPANPPDPLPQRFSVQALWDTGASGSLITPPLAHRMGIVPSGVTKVRHVGGEELRSTYIVNLVLPNQVGVAGVRVTECTEDPYFEAIIGMDVITLGDFSVTNVGGKTALSYRIPSCEAIDYVVMAKRLRFAGVARNDLCPCGSGVKFKKCCRQVA